MLSSKERLKPIDNKVVIKTVNTNKIGPKIYMPATFFQYRPFLRVDCIPQLQKAVPQILEELWLRRDLMSKLILCTNSFIFLPLFYFYHYQYIFFYDFYQIL